METFVQAGERGLKARSEDEQAVHEREVRELRAKVGRTRPGARRPKKTGSPDRETRESLLTVQGLMRAEGKAVSIAQLCRWFGVPRSTFYYRPTTAGAASAGARRGAGGDDSDDHRGGAGSRAADDHRAGPAQPRRCRSTARRCIGF